MNLGISRSFGFGPPPNNFPGMSAANRGQQQRAGNKVDSRLRTSAGLPGAVAALKAAALKLARGGAANAGGQARGAQPAGGGGPTMVMAGGGGMMMMGGPGGFGGNRHKYNLTISINASNVLNHFNEGRFNGTLTSPFFGKSNNAGGGGGGFGGFGGFGGGRRIDLSLRFNF